MALTDSELLTLVRLGIKPLSLPSYGDTKTFADANPTEVTLEPGLEITLAEVNASVTEDNSTLHVGFTGKLTEEANTVFSIIVDGIRRPNTFETSGPLVNFSDFVVTDEGSHSISVAAYTTESTTTIGPREAKLGVYL